MLRFNFFRLLGMGVDNHRKLRCVRPFLPSIQFLVLRNTILCTKIFNYVDFLVCVDYRCPVNVSF